MASSMKTEPATQANALTTAPTKFSRDKNGTIVRIDILTFERGPDLKRVRYVIKRHKDNVPGPVVVDNEVLEGGILVVGALLDGTNFHEALKPFSLTLPSDESRINSALPVETIFPMIMLEQNVPISGESIIAPSRISTKSYAQSPEFST